MQHELEANVIVAVKSVEPPIKNITHRLASNTCLLQPPWSTWYRYPKLYAIVYESHVQWCPGRIRDLWTEAVLFRDKPRSQVAWEEKRLSRRRPGRGYDNGSTSTNMSVSSLHSRCRSREPPDTHSVYPEGRDWLGFVLALTWMSLMCNLFFLPLCATFQHVTSVKCMELRTWRPAMQVRIEIVLKRLNIAQ